MPSVARSRTGGSTGSDDTWVCCDDDDIVDRDNRGISTVSFNLLFNRTGCCLQHVPQIRLIACTDANGGVACCAGGCDGMDIAARNALLLCVSRGITFSATRRA